MKMQKPMKKTMAFVLSICLLLSALVIGAPVSHAVTGPSSTYGNTVPSTTQPASNNAAKYRVRLCIHEDDGFDKSIHDNVNYVAGVSYGVNNSKRNVNGTSTADDNGNFWCEYAKITYKDMNGTGTEGAVWFNLGDKDEHGRSDVISAGGQDYGYFPSDDGIVISGFPTSVYTRYYEKGNGAGGYTVYLQVAVWTASNEWEWSEGTCTGTGFLGIGGWNADNAGGVVSGATGSISTGSSGTVLPLTLRLSDSSKYPKAQAETAPAVSYNVNSLTCPATYGSTQAKATLSYISPTDQYGAVMAAKITTDCAKSAAGIFQNGNTTSISFLANLSGDVDVQTVKTTVTWVQYVTSSRLSSSAVLEVKDATYPVTWCNDAGEVIATDTYSYGDTPDRIVPAKEYDNYHYIDAHWDHVYEPVSNDSNNTYTAVYTPTEHAYEDYVSINANMHKATCYVDSEHIHTETFAHSLQTQVVPATCTKAGYTTHICAQCGYHYESDEVPALTHRWNQGEITTAPTCEKNGVKTYTCLNCGETKTEILSIIDHELELVQTAPLDKQAGKVCYTCALCHKYWQAVYSARLGDYDIPDETPFETLEQAMAASDALPAPFFNTYVDNSGYDYADRGASLKYVDLKLPNYQPLRFTQSVKVPENVNWHVGESGNAISDIGIVYSQTEVVGGKENLVLGNENVYAMHITEKNSGVLSGNNWSGLSVHEGDDGTQLTMNLVINVCPANWSKAYCARAFITYDYNGFTYTVYDEGFSSRSVEEVAQAVVANPAETQAAREYCDSIILENIKDL